jgi:acyl-homoserine-lactone acylase
MRTQKFLPGAVFAWLVLAAFATAEEATTLAWDHWGSVHITAPDEAAAAYAQGWAQMRSNGHALLCVFAAGRGELAASPCPVPAEAALDSDRRVSLFRLADFASEWKTRQPPADLARIESFVAGINAYAEDHPDFLDPSFSTLLPVTVDDVLARLAGLTTMAFPAPPDEVAAEIAAWTGGEAVRPSAIPQGGSNAAAVAPSRSATSQSLLLANPHLPWTDEFRWFEFETVLPDRRFNGVGLLGLPGHLIGFSDRLGWSQTVSQMHHRYYFELDLAPGGYILDGATVPFDRQSHDIAVQRDDGTTTSVRFDTRWSVFGPVVAERDGQALALWTVGRDAPLVLSQYRDMAAARDLAQFTAAVRRQDIPMFSIVYADAAGQIGFFYGGRQPSVGVGGSRRILVRPGTSAAALPTGVVPFDDLPNLVDPPSGWLQNANDPPWSVTLPPALLPDAFEAGLTRTDSTNLRAQRILKWLASHPQVDADALGALKNDTAPELALRVLPDLLAAAELANDPDIRRGLEVLRAWDGTTDAGASGAPLFLQWVRLMPDDGSVFAEPFDPADPVRGPAGLSDPAAAARTLGEAVRQVEALAGDAAVRWGDAFRLPGGLLPANGAPDPLGVIRATYYGPAPGGPGFEAVGGDGYALIVSPGSSPGAQGLLALGNFTEEPVPGIRPQIDLYATRSLRPVLTAPLAPADVVLTETLSPASAEDVPLPD